MVALMAAVAIMMIMLAAAAPSWRYVMRNDAEEELIFRGGEIADAVARYQKRNGNALPPSLEVLVKGKFLRRAYKDPMTKHGRWRFIRPGEAVAPAASGIPGTDRGHDDDHHHDDHHPAVGVLTARDDPRRLPGRGQHEHREEPAHLQRADTLQRVGLSPGSAAGGGQARRAGDTAARQCLSGHAVSLDRPDDPAVAERPLTAGAGWPALRPRPAGGLPAGACGTTGAETGRAVAAA